MGGRSAAMCLILSACMPGLPVVLKPMEGFTTSPSHHHHWTLQVQKAADTWNRALSANCGVNGTPVTLSEDGDVEVYLLTPLEWTWRSDWNGVTITDQVWIKNGVSVDNQPILLHELGHVFGLEHSDDPESVMWGANKINFPTEEDAASVGCDWVSNI